MFIQGKKNVNTKKNYGKKWGEKKLEIKKKIDGCYFLKEAAYLCLDGVDYYSKICKIWWFYFLWIEKIKI